MIDKMKKHDKVGSVCGRVRPIGSGPIVWYQIFEYAVGHWLQKATGNLSYNKLLNRMIHNKFKYLI